MLLSVGQFFDQGSKTIQSNFSDKKRPMRLGVRTNCPKVAECGNGNYPLYFE